MATHYLGIDIGGTNIKFLVLDQAGKTVLKNTIPTHEPTESIMLWKEKVKSLIFEMFDRFESNFNDSLRCAISAPGLVDIENRMTLFMPERLKGIEHFNWSVELSRDISVINDGHAACLAEYHNHIKDDGVSNMLMLTLGTGVGGGIIIDGKLFQGNIQRAGHIGHMSVDFSGPKTMTNMPGSLEYAMGDFSVYERTDGEYTSVAALVAAYEKGDSKAKAWWLASVEKLAVALCSLINIVSPEIIILGGGIAAGAGDALFIPLREYMKKYEWRPGNMATKIQTATLGNYAGAIGAAYFAMSKN